MENCSPPVFTECAKLAVWCVPTRIQAYFPPTLSHFVAHFGKQTKNKTFVELDSLFLSRFNFVPPSGGIAVELCEQNKTSVDFYFVFSDWFRLATRLQWPIGPITRSVVGLAFSPLCI